jgi:glycosyltransferase involved in cell wall biosynthesis
MTTANRRFKVLQIGKFYPPHRGGMESHLKMLCDQIRPDVDVEALVSNTNSNTSREVFDGVPLVRLGSVARLASTSVNPAMAAEIRYSEADLVHLHWPNPMGAVAYLMSDHKGPLVVTYHSDVVKQRVLGHLFAPVLRLILGRARAILVSSEKYAETSAALRPHRGRCSVVPFGIHEDFFRKPNEKEVREIRAQYGEQLILSAGRLVDYKGFGILIQAMVSAPGRLIIAGDGPLREELTALAGSLGLSDRVVFTGEPSDRLLRNLYHAADVFALASTDRREAFGLVQAEAMAAGKPVINTNLASGVPFVSLNNVTGLTVPPADIAALGSAITRLMNDAVLRGQLGRAARERADMIFRPQTMGARTLQIYEQALGAKRPSAHKLSPTRVSSEIVSSEHNLPPTYAGNFSEQDFGKQAPTANL